MKNDKPLITTIFIVIISYIIGVYFYTKIDKQEVPNQPVISIDFTNWLMAIEHIKKYEGYSSTTYQLLPDTNWYIGYGYRMKHKNQFNNITEVIGDSLMESILIDKIIYCNKIYNVNGNKALALGLVHYRCGRGLFRTFNLHKHLLSGNKDSIKKEWLDINKFDTIKPHKQTQERAVFEWNLYNNY